MKRFIVLLISLSACMAASAAPAHHARVVLTQPDGSTFHAILSGDEFMKIKTTESGESIIQDEDGWWSYAVYDASGQKKSTGYHVGSVSPESILGQSRNVPYDMLLRRANQKRREANYRRLQRMPSPMRLSANTFADQKNKAALVILAQFKGGDEKFKDADAKGKFTAMLTQNGYSYNGATGCAKEYFDQQFNGKHDFSFDVTDVVTVSQRRSYYGANDKNGNDENPHKMVMEACKLADEKIDFKKYDQDGDGEVDNVFVFFAGLDEASGAEEDHIWSHAWFIKDGAGEDLFLDGVRINRYACAAELEGNTDKSYMTAIGTFCHEYSHTLGLPDFYDTDYPEGGFAAALWLCTSLMDGGNYNNNGNTPPYFNAIEREILELSQPVIISEPGTYEMLPINKGTYYRINTTTENEYFLLEYRDNSLWDKYIGGSGVLVYHIDKSTKDAGYSYLYERDITALQRWNSQVEINAYAEHQCADLIEADFRQDVFSNYTDNTYSALQKSLGGLFFPYNDKNSLTPLSEPGLKCWNQTEISFAITDIVVKDGKATFNVVSFSGEDMPLPVNVTTIPFQDSAIITFESSEFFSGDAKVVYGPTGGETQVVYVEPYEAGKWALNLSGLEPTTSYSLQISFVSGGALGDSVKTSFLTKKSAPGAMPYIYLNGVERNDDGSFPVGAALPLKVYNASKAIEIHWKFNGNTITPGKDMYYHVQSSGKLEAYVVWEDGSEDVIIKDLRVK